MSDTSGLTLTPLHLNSGLWEGVLSVPHDAAPQLAVHCGDRPLEAPEIAPDDEGGCRVRVALPADSISDGMQAYIITVAETGEQLASFVIAAGDVLRDDLRGEVALLRAELDLLKRAFRRQARQGE